MTAGWNFPPGGWLRRAALWLAVCVPALAVFLPARWVGREYVALKGAPGVLLVLRAYRAESGTQAVLTVLSDSGFSLAGKAGQPRSGELGKVALSYQLARLRGLGLCAPHARSPRPPPGQDVESLSIRVTAPGMDCSLVVDALDPGWHGSVYGELSGLLARAHRAADGPAR